MNLLAITKHTALVERLRTSFEGAGHNVLVYQDPLRALAAEAWNLAHVILVDAEGDPMDGFRFCGLLRGETRILFQNLPIFLVLEHPATFEDQERLKRVDGDGFVGARDSIQKLLYLLSPALEGNLGRQDGPQVDLFAHGIPKALAERIRSLVDHFGFRLDTIADPLPLRTRQQGRPPLLLLGLDPTGTRALNFLHSLRDLEPQPYTILMGKGTHEAPLRRLFLVGVRDWVPLPFSPPLLLQACRRGMEWIHARRIQLEFESQINDLRERRVLLEMEAAALRNEVLMDPLTELLNRRAFNQNLENALNQWQRHRRPFVLILGDLDHFKLINDRFGHLVGDQVLRSLAQRLRASLRRSDLAFRIGGEEFAILLMETGLKAGTDVAEKIRRCIDSAPVTLDSGRDIFPTMSFGVGSPQDERDPASLFLAVDQAMYLAKHRGRNRVAVVQSKEIQEES